MLRFQIQDFQPKPRPRVTARGTYMPRGYVRWRQQAVQELLEQKRGYGGLPLAQAEVLIELRGRSRADTDNVAGGILDALVAAGILRDDRLTNVPRLVVVHVSAAGPRLAIVEVRPRND